MNFHPVNPVHPVYRFWNSVTGVARYLIVGCCLFATVVSFAVAADLPPRPEYSVKTDIVYGEVEGVKLRLDAYLPPGDGPFPTVLVVHGGAWRTGSKDQLGRYARKLANSGYAAFAINYRLAPKFKHPAQIDDCRAALRWIVANAQEYHVDTKRLGAIGYSAGGHLVALLGTVPTPAKPESSEKAAEGNGDDPVTGNDQGVIRLKAVVAGGAPCEFRDFEENSTILEFWLGGTRALMPDVYEAASPAVFVSSDDPPMFFFHGEWDALVPLKNATGMIEKLKQAGVETDLHVVKKAGHIFALFDPDSLERSVKFFDAHLKPTAISE